MKRYKTGCIISLFFLAITLSAYHYVERAAPAAHDVTKRYSSQKKTSQENKISAHSNTAAQSNRADRHAQSLSDDNEGIQGVETDPLSNTYTPRAAVTGIKVCGKPVSITPLENNSEKEARITGKIILSHNRNFIVFEYGAPDFHKPDKNKYAYKMEGFETGWKKAGSRRYAAYSGLTPGEYVFRVKTLNSGGTLKEQGDAIKIIILKPWWGTPAAYLSYFIILLLLLIIFNRWQRQYELKKDKEKSAIEETERRAKEAELQACIARARTLAIDEESKRKSLELEEARKFQLSMLPRRIPELPHLEIAAAMKTASEVGGDYYDFQVTEDGALFVAFGDATGHGLRAGTMVSVIKTLFVTNISHTDEDFDRFFNECTGTIKKIGLGNLYMALTLLKIDRCKCSLSSAGMPPVFIFRKENDMVETILLKGPPLGAIKEFSYHYDYINMDPGDTILLLSDGLAELFNRNDEMFGLERIKEVLKEVGTRSPGEIISTLDERAGDWLNYKPLDDDMTFVVIRFI